MTFICTYLGQTFSIRVRQIEPTYFKIHILLHARPFSLEVLIASSYEWLSGWLVVKVSCYECWECFMFHRRNVSSNMLPAKHVS